MGAEQTRRDSTGLTSAMPTAPMASLMRLMSCVPTPNAYLLDILQKKKGTIGEAWVCLWHRPLVLLNKTVPLKTPPQRIQGPALP
jgi:hypothetical protein